MSFWETETTPASVQKLQTLSPLQQQLQDQMNVLLGGAPAVSRSDLPQLEKTLAEIKRLRYASPDWWAKYPQNAAVADQQIADLESQIKSASQYPQGQEGLLTQAGPTPSFSLTAETQPLTQQIQNLSGALTSGAAQGYQQGLSGSQIPSGALGTAQSGYQQGLSGSQIPSGALGTAQSGYQQGMEGLNQPGWNYDDYMSQVGDPLSAYAQNQFQTQTIPEIANAFGAQDSARSSGMYDALGRAGAQMGLGLNAQMAPQAFGAAQDDRTRQLQAAQSQMQGGLSGMGLGLQGAQTQLQGGLSGLGLGTDIASQQQALAQQDVTGEFQKWQMGLEGMDPRVQMLMNQSFTPSYSYIGMPGTQTPSMASQILPPLATLGGGFLSNPNLFG